MVLVTAGIILVLSTDFFDGYFADKLDQHTALGECLDPVGDKLIVVLTIAILFKYHDLAVFTVAAGLSVLYRETIISGVRDFLGQNGESMPSIWSAKVKTAVQMVGIGFMVVGNAFDALLPQLSGYYLSVLHDG